jgi:hypothetical protein
MPHTLILGSYGPILRFITSSGSILCESEAKASNSQRMWTEVSSSVPHFLPDYILMFSQDIMSGKVSNDPGLCPVRGQ